MSYRAQLNNWKFKYLEDVETPAELPVVISAARSQQFRWNKGGAENFRKMISRVFSNKNLSLNKNTWHVAPTQQYHVFECAHRWDIEYSDAVHQK